MKNTTQQPLKRKWTGPIYIFQRNFKPEYQMRIPISALQLSDCFYFVPSDYN